MVSRFLLVLALCIFISGCLVGPDYEEAQPGIAGDWTTEKDQATTTNNIETTWWKTFGDETLNQLIAKAQNTNKDLQLAWLNIDAARANRVSRAADLYPTVDASGAKTKSKGSIAIEGADPDAKRWSQEYDTGFDASWELDIFGGKRRGLEAAEARQEAVLEDTKAVWLTVLGDVARNYFEIRGLQKRIVIT